VPAETCDYVRQATLGLQHAHENGLVHREVKPAKLLLTQQDRSRSSISGWHTWPALRCATVIP
jgi:serine/threonine protein kinase